MAPTPIALVDSKGALFTIQNEKDLIVLGPGAKANRFIRTVWTERAGFKSHTQLASNTPNIKCDSLGCVVNDGKLSLALVWHEAALMEDCWIADVILSRVPVRQSCPKPQHIIDTYEIWRNGAYAVYLDNGIVRFESTMDVRGIRPWTIIPKARSKVSSSARSKVSSSDSDD